MSQAGTNDGNDAPAAGNTILAHYLDALASDASIPGGGGAAALAGGAGGGPVEHGVPLHAGAHPLPGIVAAH